MSQTVAYKHAIASWFGFAICWAAFLAHPIVCLAQKSSENDNGKYVQRKDQFQIQADRFLTVYDKNKDGYLSVAETSNMKNPVDRLRFDFDKDNRISRIELIVAITKTVSEPEIDQKTRYLIERYFLIAELVVDLCDENGDGKLDADELNLMRRPPPPKADLNNDNQISKTEMAISLSSNAFDISKVRIYQKWQSLQKPSKPVSVETNSVNALSSPENASVLFGFLKTFLRNHDSNGNNQLDPDEVARTNWSCPWQPSDLNGDGILSFPELADRYRRMFGLTTRMIAESNTSANSADQKSKTQAKTPIKKGAPKKRFENGIEGFIGVKSRSAKPIQGRGTKKPTASTDPAKQSGDFKLEIYLLCPTDKLSVEQVQKFASAIEKMTDAKVATRVKDAAAILDCMKYDALSGTVAVGTETTMSNQTTVFTPLSEIGNTSSRPAKVMSWEEGLAAKILPKKVNDAIRLELELEKSDGQLNEDRSELEGTTNWRYKSTLKINPGKPSVVLSSSKTGHWLLVVNVTNLE